MVNNQLIQTYNFTTNMKVAHRSYFQKNITNIFIIVN